ncbi:hypothetical protein G7K71_13915 [Desulfofundulus sp. TPOSR]|uniref:hypothetical protein n=1 Tax=Desulfofundulus sp. TPOSR TaxID=2714340 RepID=UPI00140BE20E|nr:hypothetical protein [Desulfofundulus sp. TPOSR]NHM28054.1 hypothetical protein [Desulfofundulus sp. TPOSR]
MPELKLLKIARLSSHHFALPPAFLRGVVEKYGYRHLAVYQYGRALVVVPVNVEVDGEALEDVKGLLEAGRAGVVK